jgi:hypothetical protein
MPNTPQSVWEHLVKIEPRLAALKEDVEDADNPERSHFCGVTAWHGIGGRPGFKMRLYYLAGFRADKPELRTQQAWEQATEILWNSLPPCRGCLCTQEEPKVVVKQSKHAHHAAEMA